MTAVLLATLLEELDVRGLEGRPDSEVTGIAYDSRAVRKGGVFVCISGEKADGHRFVDEAVRNGASAIVAERAVDVQRRVPVAVVASSRRALARISVLFFGKPSERLRVTGVTGTNGKTTVSILSRAVLEAAGLRTGLIGTIDYRWGDRVEPAARTTPEAPDLQCLLARMLDEGCDSAVMEVSSHALEQYRVDGTVFREAVFTNISRGHLDYHGTLERYSEAKMRLFTMLAAGKQEGGTAIINADDPRGAAMQAAAEDSARCRVLHYGLEGRADVSAGGIVPDRSGVRFELEGPGTAFPVRLGLLGRGNVRNALAAACVGLARGADPEAIRRGLENVRSVRGRFERIRWDGAFDVFVDYAHTPAALEFALHTARELAPSRIITVFGCGGDRDRPKRPEMGAVASRLSDIVILTTDNPRSESPGSILAEIESGCRREGGAGYSVVVARNRLTTAKSRWHS